VKRLKTKKMKPGDVYIDYGELNENFSPGKAGVNLLDFSIHNGKNKTLA